ncbi:AMP-binding protein [Hyphococcus luteus]|uniref:Acyl-CoA synthetase n=1 Tax=Hyphococcus luteus TaxID=2058213 RepID=A0A2S7K5F3_9PROT|nr:AMP-binding protein [Marinicaulis flavus]PQA87678.1 acyl-CoA synthetase [Marinicaulis flavus]
MSVCADDLGLQARLRPGKLAVADLASGRRWTYGELDIAVARCAGALAARGVGVGARVAALSKNRAELVMLHLACARLGAIYVPLNWRLAVEEINGLLEDADPALFIFEKEFDSVSFGGVSIGMDALAEEIEKAKPRAPAPIDREKPSLILFTSGTSGRPKGALLSERNLAETAINFSMLGEVTERSVFLCDSPMFHIIGLVTNVRPVLLRGGSLLISDAFIPDRTLERLADPALKATHYFCVPQMASMLRNDPSYDPEKLRGLTAIFTGGAPHPAANIRAWLKDGISIVDGFGMSEAGTVFGMPVDRKIIDRYAGSAGLATPRVQSRIVDADGKDVATGEPGELLLKGDNIAAGYWRREQETKDAFDEDGWFKTGDIARVNEEGFHWLVDRRKDMFISGGENVYPAEIEAVVAEISQVKECAMVGVPHEKWGEAGHLFWAGHENVDLSHDDIRAALNDKVARYKLPKHYSRIAELPRNGAGKVLKNVLRDMARQEKPS